MITAKGVQGLLGAQSGAGEWTPLREVLVVDDDPAMLRLMTAILENAGYEVALATDGDEAEDCISVSAPDFIITDWKMPRINGVELCRWVRETQSGRYIYVIVCTSRTETRHMVEAISAGADDFISKPIQPGLLCDFASNGRGRRLGLGRILPGSHRQRFRVRGRPPHLGDGQLRRL